MSVLTDNIISYIGTSTLPRRELVTRRDLKKYAVATGQRLPKYLNGDEAPLLYHLTLFWDVVELNQLSIDGVSIDTLLPDFPLKKAMAGGVEMEYHQSIYPGDWLTATRTLTNIYEKMGSKGPLIFYEVTMEVVNDLGEKVITEKTTRILR
ncbi:MaoC family dehydratase N-terminal domain-containing protein [Neobacillus sp. MER 74]|uniref:FAS1-like dehydratase domain-containing protein n=1 Tax=Neobacillus sp. MER 74 TaxID=2939566 RepID=UPI00203AF0F1|nr:MaoC family dehydratase N-terminal domain-containing protein [Neobacillus sp. MER 74]MCM3118095.1 MaoC family dehydratase N-terminal domain-containing protein [Neobacillus sp. MER 74]